MRPILDPWFDHAAREGWKPSRAAVGPCRQFVINRGDPRTVISTKTHLDVQDGRKSLLKSSRLAFSTGQLNWKFVTCEQNNHFIRRILPELLKSLEMSGSA